MSVSEQEAKQQIAQMRQALESMRASARRSSYVRALGVLVGFVIVGIYVYLMISLGFSVAHSKQFVPLVKQRIEMLAIQTKVQQAVKAALPAYRDEGEKLLKGMNLQEPLEKEGLALVEELRPVLLSEVDRAWPQLQEALIVEGNEAAKQLETDLQAVLEARLEAIVRKHSTQIQGETGLTEEKTAQVMLNIIDAGQQAMLGIVEKRWGENKAKLEEIAALVDRLPALPTMTEAELLEHMRDVLMALVKSKLPDYDPEAELGQSLVRPTAASMQPARTVAVPAGKAVPTEADIQKMEEALKQPNLPPEARQAILKALENARAAMKGAE
jgi:hypothetical protein